MLPGNADAIQVRLGASCQGQGSLERSIAICLLYLAALPGKLGTAGQVVPAWLSGFIAVLQGLGEAAAALPWQATAEQSSLCGSLMPGEWGFAGRNYPDYRDLPCLHGAGKLCRQGLVM